ncbi:hypothetical protein ACIPWF_00670 [Paenarthrobacter sp. NPDC089989]|uniref:hypothetical protein n=1 Tax=unclassified Paenarthrobacter TaxID=2634190 RepID=UPI0038194124
MNRLDAMAGTYADLHGRTRSTPIDYMDSEKLLAAADTADVAAKVYRIGLDDDSLSRAAERSWDALPKHDMTRTWSRLEEREKAIWLENVRNVLTGAAAAATASCDCLLVGCHHKPALTEEANQRLSATKLAQQLATTGSLR